MSEINKDKWTFARGLRDILIEHLDGKRVLFNAKPHSHRRRAIRVMLEREWIDSDDRVNPTYTVITERGRMELAGILSDYADALSKAEEKRDDSGGGFAFVRALSLDWIASQKGFGEATPSTPPPLVSSAA